ncbi:putative leucine-rich repeat-containing protein DDB_G0290503 isoform X2 [Homarus americanus]|uniref:putative leucine-rich repeat-containing protein DDB_G0290503 isoform X2 n=1 Tax=Homarus americanus TaxID=6706 RepID=UPI001C43BB43|nr:putative leucine-rich repeat-containing protein DDB_G0290503 isoform X2 [Homarus americanus]
MPGGKTPMGRNRFYGNSHGLPGLPKSQMPLGGHPRPRAPPLMPPPPQRLPQQMARSPQPLPQPITITQPDPMAGRRMEMLEQRLNATEQSNRALLDELMRLQQDLKMNVKRNEMGLVEEKEARTRLENTFRQSQNKNYEYEDRMRRCEEALKENRNAVQQMVSHTKSIERAISTSQQEQMERRGNSAQKLQEYKHEVMKMNQSKEQLERLCFSLRDEMRETASKVDNLTQEMTSLEGNVRMQGRLLEDNSKRVLTPAKPTPINTPVLPLPPPPRSDDKMSETARLAIEGKLIHMNTNIQDLTQRLNQEAKKREKVETEVNIRMNELLEDYGSTKVEKDKEMREFDDKMKELQAGFSASEKQRILMEISSVAQDLSRKMDEKDVKLRDDTVNKLAVIENTLLEENKRRADKEKELQDKVEAQMKEAKLYGDSGTDSLKKHIDQHEEQTRNKLGEMANNISNLDSQMNEHRLQQEKVLAAEITERNNAIKAVEGKVDDVDHRARMGIAQLQAAVGDASKNANTQPGRASPDYDEIQRMQADNADGIREQLAKDMGRMENRLGEVETKIKQQDDRLDNKLQASKAEDQEANSIMGDKMQQKIDSVIFSQERLKKQVDSLQNKVQDTPKSVANLKDDLNELETKLNKKVDQERKERVDGVKELRGDIDRIIGREEQNAASVPSLARLNQDVDETQTGMKKLAEAVHVVKTSLSERIKDEKKLREQEGTIVRRDVDRLNTKYNELREKIKTTTRATAVAS